MHRSVSRRHVVALALLALLIGLCVVGYGNADAAKSTKIAKPAPTVVKELPQKRTENSETFLLSNGTYKAVVYSGPIHYKDAGGSWQKIDTKLSAGSTSGDFSSKATPLTVAVSSQLAPTVSLTYQKHVVSMSLRGANRSIAQLGSSHSLKANPKASGVGIQGNSSQISTSSSGSTTTLPRPPTTIAAQNSVSPLALTSSASTSTSAKTTSTGAATTTAAKGTSTTSAPTTTAAASTTQTTAGVTTTTVLSPEDSSTATFTNIAPDADLSYQVLDDGVKESVVLYSASAQNTFTFTINHQGLILKKDKTGQWGFYDSQEDPTPSMVLGALQVADSNLDARGQGVTCASATMTVTPGKDSSTITYTVPQSWLSDPARKFPVTIDPTVTQNSIQDTFVSGGYPNNSYGSIDHLADEYIPGSYYWLTSFVKFDLPTDLANGAQVQSANLYFRQYYQSSSSAQYARISAMPVNWSESSTYNSLGATNLFGSETVSVLTTGAQAQDLNFNVKNIVQEWSDATKLNYGFSLYQNYTDVIYRGYGREVYSKEYTTPAYRPQLTIVYSSPIDVTAPAYGADPTGAADSTTAIQSAINAASNAGGGTVYFPGGTYKVSGLTVSASNVTLRGTGTSSLITPASDTQDHLVQIDSSSQAPSNITITSLSFRMPKAGNGIKAVGTSGTGINLTSNTFSGGDDSATTKAVSVDAGFSDVNITDNDLSLVTCVPMSVAEQTGHTRSVFRNRTPVQPYDSNLVVGADAYDSTIRSSRAHYPSGASTVVLMTGQSYTLSASASVLARDYGAPIITTHESGLDAGAQAELQRLAPSKVFLVGLSDTLYYNVRDALGAVTITNETGADVYATAANIATEVKNKQGAVNWVVIAPSDEYTAALSISPEAAHQSYPVLLTPKNGPVPSTTSNWYTANMTTPKAVVVGTNASVPGIQSQYLTRIYDPDIYTQAGDIVWYEWACWGMTMGYTTIASGNGTDWQYSLDAGATVGANNGLILLSNGETLSQACSDAISAGVSNLDELTYRNVTSTWVNEQSGAMWLPQAPRHTSCELGSFADHSATAELDTQSLNFSTTDLSISSFGPQAVLSRNYSSSGTSSTYFAPGWTFNFEQKIATVSAGKEMSYTDETGDVYYFLYNGSFWEAPAGYQGQLSQSGSTWILRPTSGEALTFDSSGRLTSEADGNGNTTTYTWASGSVTIKAANNQQIVVSINGSNKATQAVYSTSNGTRTVTYATAAPWTVTYSYSGGTSTPSRSLTYGYTSNLLTGITATAFTSAGDSTEGFSYTGSQLTGATFADYNSSTNPDARATIAYNGQSATITRYGRIYSGSVQNDDVTGTAGRAVTQTYTWNTSGTMASRTEPKYGSEATKTWTYTYSPRTNYELSETSPLSKTKSWTYNNHGNTATATDELNHTTTYSYPDADPGIPRTITVKVGVDIDDSYDANTTLAVTGSKYDVVGRGTYVDKAGWTFRNINIPQGSTISSAYLTLYAQADANGSVSNLVTQLGLEKATNVLSWGTGTHEPRTATMTTNKVTNWRPASWAVGNWYTSPDLSASVQEVVNQTGWAAKNNVAVLWLDSGTAATNLVNVGDYYNGTPASLTITYVESADANRDSPDNTTDPVNSAAVTHDDVDRTTGNLSTETVAQSSSHSAETDNTYSNPSVGGATYKGAQGTETDSISGSSSAETEYGSYAASGDAGSTQHDGVVLQSGGNPTNLTEQSSYDSFGSQLTKADKSGQTVKTATYDICGRILTNTGHSFTATVNGSGVSTQLVVHHTYDAWGHETETWTTSTGDVGGTKADWSVTMFDKAGRQSQVQKKLTSGAVQSTVTYTYDGLGKEISQADTTASGLPELTSYDAQGQEIASWAGGACTGTYDIAKATSHLNPDGTPGYDATGNVLVTQDPGENPTTCTYDNAGHVLTQTNPDGSTLSYTYDADGSKTQEVSSTKGTTNYTYDLDGHMLTMTSPAGLTTTYTYDDQGRQTSAGANGHTASTSSYNNLGWQIGSTDADGVVTTKIYDTAGRVTSQTVAGNTTTYTYDGLGHITYKDDPDDRQTTYTYDLFGHQLSDVETLPGSPRTTVKNTQTTYDSLDRQTQVTDSVRNLTHAYSYPANTAGNTTDTQNVGTSGSDLVQTVQTTGADGYESSRASTITNGPSLTRTINSRDNAKRVTKATLAAGQPTSIFSQFSYDAAGRLTKQWGPDTGDGSGFLAAASTTNAYTYNSTTGLKTADNLQLQSVGTSGAITSSYTYDSFGRLSQAVTNGSTENDAFDVNGNLISIGSGTSLTYGTSPNQGNQLSTITVGGTTTYYSYDQSYGWRTSQGPQGTPNINFGYTATGRLSSYQNTTTGVSATYTHDGAGQRTQSQVTIAGQTTTTNFTYEGLLLKNFAANRSGGTGATSWEIMYLYDESGRPYAGVYRQPWNSTSPVAFGMVTTDRGDVVELVDAAGNPFVAYRYDAWGNPQGTGNGGTGIWSQNTSLIASQVASDIASRQVLRYASYCYDSESGLYYLSARSYDPQTRQFLSKDEAKANGEESEYQYCGGSPIVNCDLSGKYTASIAVAYADKYAHKTNSVYGRYYTWRGEDDCTNFVSQCLFSGKIPMAGCYKNGKSNSVWWWKSKPGPPMSLYLGCSNSWVGANALCSYLLGYGPAKGFNEMKESDAMYDAATYYGAQPGDVVFYDWGGEGKWDHSAIIATATPGYDSTVDAHTNDHYHADPWSLEGINKTTPAKTKVMIVHLS